MIQISAVSSTALISKAKNFFDFPTMSYLDIDMQDRRRAFVEAKKYQPNSCTADLVIAKPIPETGLLKIHTRRWHISIAVIF